VPFIRKALRRPSFVIRERLQNGKLLFFLLDPTSENNAEQPQLLFQEITEQSSTKNQGCLYGGEYPSRIGRIQRTATTE
jgi:hypothetical protein